MEKPTLVEVRKQRGFSAAELGRRAGVGASTARRIEHGDRRIWRPSSRSRGRSHARRRQLTGPATPLAWEPSVRACLVKHWF
jgi:ribosomal protein L13E